jgi:hypothetical protein
VIRRGLEVRFCACGYAAFDSEGSAATGARPACSARTYLEVVDDAHPRPGSVEPASKGGRVSARCHPLVSERGSDGLLCVLIAEHDLRRVERRDVCLLRDGSTPLRQRRRRWGDGIKLNSRRKDWRRDGRRTRCRTWVREQMMGKRADEPAAELNVTLAERGVTRRGWTHRATRQ